MAPNKTITENEIHPTAVVVELGINALGIIKSLGKRRIPVIGIDSKLSNYGALSRYCKTLFCKDVNDIPLVEALISIGRTFQKKGVLFCTSDLSLLVVSKYREELENLFSFVLPPNRVIETLMNKRLFHEFAVKHRFSVPETYFTHNREDVEKAGCLVSYPCVIKPEIRDSCWYQNFPHSKVLFVQSREEYFALFKKYRISNNPLIVQEWIDGNDDDVYFCLTYIDSNSKPLAIFTGRKIRQWPVLTGLTSAAESLWEPFIAQEAVRLLGLAGCKGIAGVEFKFCRKERIFKITEPTVGRTDLQEAISTKSGLDIPYIAYIDAIGKTQRPSNSFKEYIKWINEPLDIYSVLQYWKEQKYNLLKLLASYKGKRAYALMDIHDPLPFLFFLRKTFKKAVSKIRGGGGMIH